MISTEQQAAINSCYDRYCDVIKPLMADIEARAEAIPLPIFNEIRAFNDHIARCHYNNPTSKYIDEQISKAERHICRITLDCFKCLNVLLYERIELFDCQTRNIDLTVIDNGTFFPDYSRKRAKAASIITQAKRLESIDINAALSLYEESNAIYTSLVDAIVSQSEAIKWARRRFTIRKWLAPTLWILSVIISAILSAYFSCEFFQELLQ